jgi:transposase-like protein
VCVSKRRDIGAAARFLTVTMVDHGSPRGVTVDRVEPLLAIVDELIPEAFHAVM